MNEVNLDLPPDLYYINRVDTTEDFLNALKAKKSDNQQVSSFSREEWEDYFQSLVKYTTKAEDIQVGELEKALMCGCWKVDLEDTYYMPADHPVISLLDEEEQELREKYAEFQGKSGNTEWRICRTVMDRYLKQRKEMYAYGAGQVYFVREDGSKKPGDEWQSHYEKAVAWSKVGTLTSLDALRLIQKVKIRFKRGELTESDSEIHIAYIGEIKGEQRLQRYFEEASTSGSEKGKLPTKIYFTKLIRQPEYGEYIFARKDDKPENDADYKRIYNLSSLADMQELFRSFDIVLFLDESYFYKQRQTPKGLFERALKSHIQWCWKELERERQLAEEKKRTIRCKERCYKERYYYKEIYNKVGLWMNGYGKDKSSKLGFDQELFHTMQQAVSEKSDVYVYISRGKVIGDTDLVKQSVCNDELYDGKRILVYKMTRANDLGNSSVSDEVEELLDVVNLSKNKGMGLPLAEIDLWKLAKSIGEEFYQEYFSEKFSHRSLEIWKKTYLDVYADNKNHKKLLFKLRYTEDMQCDENEKGILEDFVKVYLKICKGEDGGNGAEHSPYVKNYLFDLLTKAMVARARSARGIFYAYLLRKKNDFIDFAGIGEDDNRKWVEEKKNENINIEELSKIRGRRVIYSAIENLDQVMIRDMEKRVGILKYDFRHEYCPEMDEDVFLRFLDSIKDYCEYTEYTDSRLYLLTGGKKKNHGNE